MNKLIKRLNKGEEKMKKKKMMSVIVAMMLVVGMLGCSKESGEGDTSKEKSTEYSCAATPQIRQTGNRLSGLAETAYASLLAQCFV